MARRLGDLTDFDARVDFGAFVCERAGLRPRVGERQTWRVGAVELVVEFALDKARYVHIVYVRAGWPMRPARKALALAEVYAAAVTQTLDLPRGPELRRWKIRALLEAGLVDWPRLRLRQLDDHAPAAARATWEVITGLCAVRTADGDDDPLPLVTPFLARWSGLDEKTIRAGKRWLEANQHIRHVADGPVRFGRPMKLWVVATDDAHPEDEADDLPTSMMGRLPAHEHAILDIFAGLDAREIEGPLTPARTLERIQLAHGVTVELVKREAE